MTLEKLKCSAPHVAYMCFPAQGGFMWEQELKVMTHREQRGLKRADTHKMHVLGKVQESCTVMCVPTPYKSGNRKFLRELAMF